MTLEQLRAPSHFGLGICSRRSLPHFNRTRRRTKPSADCPSSHRVRIALRSYQIPVFMDRTSGILILHWSRQIGKSFTLAAWAVDRLLSRPGRLVTVLSNSRENGAEFLAKCAEVCHLNGTQFESQDLSRGLQFQNMRMEIRIRSHGQTGRIKVLAANPRTARGFSGDLILDEFAFHEDSAAIWEAAEPILASNPDYLCRIASTGNGRHNLFYRLASGTSTISTNPVGTTSTSSPSSPPPSAETSPRDVRPTVSPVGQSCRFALTSPPFQGEEAPSSVSPSSSFSSSSPDPSDPSNSPSVSSAQSMAKTRSLTPPALAPLTPSNTPLPTPSHSGYPVSRIPRSLAFQMGVPIYDPLTRQPIAPDHARTRALDKRAYDQNYECSFADENFCLLSHSLISAAESDTTGYICEQTWSNPILSPSSPGPSYPSNSPHSPDPSDQSDPSATSHLPSLSSVQSVAQFPLDFLRSCHGPLFAGLDVGRKIDLSVLTVLEDLDGLLHVRAILRMRDLRLPDQQLRLAEICRLPRFRRAAIDMTGLGLGLCEYAQQQFGATRIIGINFATTVPLTKTLALEGRRRETVRVTEALATELLQTYEDRRLRHPCDAQLRDDLRKPEKITTPGGRVSIAACRDEAGHADHFWSLALALEAAAHAPAPFAYKTIQAHRPHYLL